MIKADDFCVFYQRYVLDLTELQLDYCHSCNLDCSRCPQRMKGWC